MLGVVLPGIGGIKFSSVVADHPMLAAILLGLYEVLLAVIGFVGKVFGELQGRWVPRVADAVDRWVLLRRSHFEREYRRRVHSANRFIDLNGLATRGDHTPGLEQVFVDVSLAPRPVHDAERESLAGPAPVAAAAAVPARQSIDEFLDGPESECLAVIGAPGTGKTTLLKHLAVRLSRPGRVRPRPRRDLPVLLYLRDHAAAIMENAGMTLPEVITASLSGLQAEEPAGWFERQLKGGRCLVLLDGLDEVARDTDRRQVSAWVEKQIERYEGNDFVLTSRPHGYKSAPVNRARVLQVRRFTGEQISRFLHGWYQAIERISTGVDDPGVTVRASAAAEDLLRRLRDRPVLYDLAANPLLLTMIANVHRYRGALPGSRAELFAEICQVLLWRRAEAKNPSAPVDEVPGAKKEAVLQDLAYAMMIAGQRDIRVDRAAELLEPMLSRVAVITAPADFLDSVVASGLLVERERGLFAFAHLTLQEHLAALHIHHHRLTDILTSGVDDDWWRETTLLYAAGADPAPIVEACLVSNSARALALAFDCAEESTEFHPQTARRLDSLRQRALEEPADSPLRRLMTAVTITRQLREVVRLNDDTLTTARPITREVYRLFAADTDAPTLQGAAEIPDDAPAHGMSRQDALTLVRWINDLLPDGTAYRLPTREEVTDRAFALTARSPEHTVWYSTGDPVALPALWTPEGAPHPWAAQLTTPAELPGVLAVGVLGIVLAPIQVLTLDDVLTSAHGLEDLFDLEQARNFTDDVTVRVSTARDHNLARARDLTGRLASELHRARQLNSNLNSGGRDLALIHARDYNAEIARELERGLDLGRVRNFTSKLDEALNRFPRNRDYDRTHDLAHELNLTIARALAHDRVLAVDLAAVLDLDPELRRTNDLARALDGARTPESLRLRLAVLVCLVLQEVSSGGPSVFAERVTGVQSQLSQRTQSYTVYPDQVSAILDTATTRLVELAAENETSASLIRDLAMSTAALAVPLPDVREATGRVTAAYLCVAAVTLAAAADQQLHDPELADLYRTIAAGVTILRYRADGTITPTETLILART
ncbi:NACHT domain-containing protein [Streptomyces mirabilis]|uniref:NACHT domain-containing protein n=1 Tax=Streptomyces mirabilis TaxID=68239 RepID=UPI0036AB6F04